MTYFRQPPLPFLGNKRNHLKNIKSVVDMMFFSGSINKETIFLDVFGGSGLISHNLKFWYPNNEVIYNDFDNYQARLSIVEETEIIRQKSLDICGYYKKGISMQMSKVQKNEIIKILEKYNVLDTITLSTYYCFSSNYYFDRQSLYKNIKYIRIPKLPIQYKDYLKGVEIVGMDFIDLLERYKNVENKLLILDPPYLQTEIGNYKQHFTLKQFINLFKYVKKPYLMFGSEKSDILDFLDFFKDYNTCFNDFEIIRQLSCNKGGFSHIQDKFDYMIYNQQKNLFSS